MTRIILAGLLASFLSATSLSAQSPMDRALARADRQIITALETAMTQHTGRNTTIVYMKKLPGLFDVATYCGTALFGSDRQRFVIDMSQASIIAEPSQAAWLRAGCETNPPSTRVMVDYR